MLELGISVVGTLLAILVTGAPGGGTTAFFLNNFLTPLPRPLPTPLSAPGKRLAAATPANVCKIGLSSKDFFSSF